MDKNIQKQKINDSLKKLREKLIEVAMYTNIIDCYYDEFEVNKKTQSFAMIMNEFTRHIIGQLVILIFDISNTYQLASLQQLHNDISRYAGKNNDVKGYRHQKVFKLTHNELCDM